MHLTLALPADIAARVGVDLAAVETNVVVAGAEPAGDATESTDDRQDPSLLGSIAGLAPLILIGVLGYMMLIRPARRRQREQAELSRSIEVGDEVVLTSGVVGFISAKEADVYWVEIDDDVQIRVLPGAVSRKFSPAAAPAAAGAGDEPGAASTKPSVKGRAKQDDAAQDEAVPDDAVEAPAESTSDSDA